MEKYATIVRRPVKASINILKTFLKNDFYHYKNDFYIMRFNPEKSVAALVAVALIGLISVQAYWAKRTYKDAEEVYTDKITKILTSVCKEATEASTCFTLYSKTYINPQEGIYLMKSKWEKSDDEKWDKKHFPDSLPMFFNIPEEYKNSPLNQVYHDLKFSDPATVEILLKFRYDENEPSPDKEILSQKPSTENFKELIRNHEDLLSIYDTLMIDSLIRYQLKSNNIPARYYYALVKSENDSIEYSGNPALTGKILAEGTRVRLTPVDLFSTSHDLIFYAENKREYILTGIIWILSLSVGIIFLLLVSYLYFIRTILKQKKLSEMKNDFINNITHELNTPITNISLAYETLREKEKISNDHYSEKVGQIIQTETNRLKESVSRILRISSFERNGIHLDYEKLEFSELISCALDRYELIIQQKGATIKKIFPCKPVYYYGDKLHLSNTLENLLDNALKYSNGNCNIEIELLNNNDEIEINIKDNGIGISKHETTKIFEKFYRVQHGNIQNERGFGLGLNYVKQIIEKHGGKISVNSQPGEGTRFKIILNEDEQKNKNSSR